MMKKKMIMLGLCLMLVCCSMLVIGQGNQKKRNSQIKYFSKNSLYVYGMGTMNNFDAPGEYWEDWGYATADTFAPMVGIGYRVFNGGNRIFVNVEFDYMPTEFDADNGIQHKVDFFSIMTNVEGRFFNTTPLTLLLGVGVGIIEMKDQWDWYGFVNDTRVTLVFEAGFKYPIVRKLFFRGGIRFYSEVYPDYDSYYYDEWGNEYNDSDLDRLATTVMLGLEFHF